MSADAKRLRQAAAAMREQHGPEHERHAMWAAMADVLSLAADHAEGGPGVGSHVTYCGSCVTYAVKVAKVYLGESA